MKLDLTKLRYMHGRDLVPQTLVNVEKLSISGVYLDSDHASWYMCFWSVL